MGKIFKSILKVIVIVVVIILIILAIMFTMGAALPAVITGFGLTYGSLFAIGFLVLAVAYMIDPTTTKEAIGKVMDSAGAVIGAIAGGIGGALASGVNSALTGSGFIGLAIIGIGGYLIYKSISNSDDKNRVQIDFKKQESEEGK